MSMQLDLSAQFDLRVKIPKEQFSWVWPKGNGLNDSRSDKVIKKALVNDGFVKAICELAFGSSITTTSQTVYRENK
jgi:hypothetical protein